MAKARFARLALIAAMVLAAGCGSDEGVYATLEGKQVRLSDYRDKVVFINYWAEWCAPCRAEIPELNRFARDYADQAVVLSVNFDGVVGDALEQQVGAMGIEFQTLLRDPRQDLDVPPAQGLPETLVIGPDGLLTGILLGPQTLESLKARLP